MGTWSKKKFGKYRIWEVTTFSSPFTLMQYQNCVFDSRTKLISEGDLICLPEDKRGINEDISLVTEIHDCME